MTQITSFSNPLLLGFETMEKTLDRLSKASVGYPPYNIERLNNDKGNLYLRITLAVAGFTSDDLDITIESSQLIIRGCQRNIEERDYIYRGIASRQFQRVFMLADGMQVGNAELKNGLLAIDLVRPTPEKNIKRITIAAIIDK